MPRPDFILGGIDLGKAQAMRDEWNGHAEERFGEWGEALVLYGEGSPEELEAHARLLRMQACVVEQDALIAGAKLAQAGAELQAQAEAATLNQARDMFPPKQ